MIKQKHVQRDPVIFSLYIVTVILLSLILITLFVHFFVREPIISTGSESAPSNIVGNAENETASANQDAATAMPVEIAYTDEGFSPAVIQINSGQTVMFTNHSGALMQVVSVDDKTETPYHEFHQPVGIKNGQSYKFTFQKAGTWQYENMANPHHNGAVIVR